MKLPFLRFLRDSRGVAALEYALLVGFITLAIAAVIGQTGFKNSLNSIFTNLNSQLSNAATNN